MCHHFLDTNVILSVLQCHIKILMHIFLVLLYDIFPVTYTLCHTDIQVLLIKCRMWCNGMCVVEFQ